MNTTGQLINPVRLFSLFKLGFYWYTRLSKGLQVAYKQSSIGQ